MGIKPHNCVIRYQSSASGWVWSYEATLQDVHDHAEAKRVLCAELGHKPENVLVVSIVSVKPAEKVDRAQINQ